MNSLLDTCEFLWLASDPAQLSPKARQFLQDRTNQLFLSAVSLQEIAIKHGIGKQTLPDDPVRFVPEACGRLSLTPLPLFPEAALLLSNLPLHHRDPFDRTLICQAIFHHVIFASSDDKMPPYPITLL